MLIGCDNKGDDKSSQRDVSIILKCSGENINYTTNERDNMSYLIKLQEVPIQQSLLFYNDDEKRFVRSACFKNFNECQVNLDSDMITEYGVLKSLDGDGVSMTIKTTINRRTGEMRILTYDPVFKEKVSFEGSCKKSELPIEIPQKF